ncbi:hypothetical protein [Culturomica massiliensis]|uniref:hypothetical protein n=1 Tax=Culturomica massiliensis TaxID=1841857 RepID=UPI0008395570|nr:hypothetical protein [Culturomica massiliensis]
MKTLKNLKSLLVIAALPVMMSGCVKSNDPEFTAYPGGYILQKNNDFAVYLNVTANETMKSAEVISADNPFLFMRQVFNVNVWEIPETSLQWRREMPNGGYKFTVTNTKEESAVAGFTLNIDKTKPLGTLKLKKFEMKNGEISMEVDGTVENATAYYLMFALGAKSSESSPYEFKRCYANFVYWGWDTNQKLPTSARIKLRDIVYRATNGFVNLTENDVVYIAFAAARTESNGGSLIMEYPQSPIEVTLKTDENFLVDGPVTPVE